MKQAQNTQLTVREIYSGVTDGKIISDIDLQRDIVYDAEKQALVIDSLMAGIPLPAFYFWRNSDGILEVLDGKQRIEAIKKFLQNDLKYDDKIWKEFDSDIQVSFNQIQLSVIICEGDESLKREIFRRINTLGVPLSSYEVLNGLYHGRYLEELTDYANMQTACTVLGGNSRGKNQMHILKWLLLVDGRKPSLVEISDYVKSRKNGSFVGDKNRINPYLKFIKDIFVDYSLSEVYFGLSLKYVKDVAIWKGKRDMINAEVKAFRKSDAWKLIADRAGELEDRLVAVTKGISTDPKRFFTPDDKASLVAGNVDGDGKCRCAACGQSFFPDELTVDHVLPWSKGGRTELSNAQLLCRACNSRKGNR